MKKVIEEIAQYLTDNNYTPNVSVIGYYYGVDDDAYNIDVIVTPAEDENANQWAFTVLEASVNQPVSIQKLENHVKALILAEMN